MFCRAAFLALILHFASAIPVWADLPQCLIQQLTHRLQDPQVDTAIELEMRMNPDLMAILTTQDGKVGSVLETLPPPDWLAALWKQKYRQLRSPKEIPWDELTDHQKHQLLKYQGARRKVSFFDDRTIHGIKVRDRIRLRFDEPTDFLGTRCEARKPCEVSLSSYLSGAVEYGSPDAKGTLDMLELHFRGALSSGELSNQARLFQKGIGADVTHQHAHVVARLPIERLRARPEVEAALMGDYVRRTNLLAEMISIFNGRTISRKTAAGDVELFDSFKASDLYGVTRYFQDAGRGILRRIGDNFKMGWVGMHGSDKYDQPGLWGLQYRAISGDLDPEVSRAVLDNLQWHLNRQQWGMSAERAKRWMKVVSGSTREPGLTVGSAWYNHDLPDMLERLPARVERAFDDPAVSAYFAKWDGKTHKELKMLLHDWSRDSLFFDDGAMQLRIIDAQAKALTKFGGDEKKINAVMQEFLIESGIAEAVAKSLAAEIHEPAPGAWSRIASEIRHPGRVLRDIRRWLGDRSP